MRLKDNQAQNEQTIARLMDSINDQDITINRLHTFINGLQKTISSHVIAYANQVMAETATPSFPKKEMWLSKKK